MTPRSIAAAWAAALLGSTCAVMLVACGGSVGSGGTGMTAASAQGTVTGFGSVIVDGQRFDDSQVPTLQETEPGVDTPSETKLGDRVELGYSGTVANSLRVEPALVGNVASAGPAPGEFVVLGQRVIVNADAALGPITQFGGGYTGPASVQVGDVAEVHGLLVQAGGATAVQATRVDRLAALPRYLKMTGLVSGLAGSDFSIGILQVDVATAAIVPPGRALANGEVVSVLALPATLSGDPTTAPRVTAAQVRIKKIGNDGDMATVSGAIGALDAVPGSFDLGGLHVLYGGAAIAPAGMPLANGLYVRVSGRVLADGSLQAESVTVRDGQGEAEAELKGNILGFDAATQRFQVRGVDVDASSAQIEGCPGNLLAEGLYVELEGRLSATMVIAQEVHCEDEPSGATVEREGTASAVDVSASTFVLTAGTRAPITVRWTAQTFFSGATPATLEGKRVEVEGSFDNGTLNARKVSVDD